MASETGLDRQTWCKNGIDLRGLQLEHNHRVACDAWSRQREQPLTVSVRVSFRQPFTTAAANDALDDGTLHYGHLAKRLRAIKAASEWECLQGLSDRIHDTVCEPTKAAQLLQSCEVELHLPKASLLGKGITFTSRRSYVDQTLAVVRQNMLQLSSVNIATIVGVNSNEREHKQPLLFDLWVYNLPRANTDVYTVLEDLLVKTVEPTLFETLESLVLYLIKRLSSEFMHDQMPEASLRVRMEKPLAVPYADAPAIEVFRTSEQLSKHCESPQQQDRLNSRIRIVRPYLR